MSLEVHAVVHGRRGIGGRTEKETDCESVQEETAQIEIGRRSLAVGGHVGVG